MALTDTVIRNLKPEGCRRELLVADVGGLSLRVRVGSTGKVTRTWQFRRKGDGVVRITTLGAYPGLPLKEARLKAAVLALKRAETKGPTVAEAADQWHDEIVSKSHKDAERVRWYLDKAMRDIGDLRVAEVEPRHIAKLVRDYRDHAAVENARATSGGRTAARKMLGILKGLGAYCVAVGWVPVSPAAAITAAALGESNKARSRVLDDGEIRWVLQNDSPQAAAWRFMLCTGLRIGELYAGRRDGGYWMVPAEKSKNGKAHRVHLSPLALEQLREPWAPRWSVQTSLSMQNKGWTCHDLRRTFATRLNDMKLAPPHVVEKALNHALPGVQAVYNHATYDDERRAALEAWSAWLLALVDRPTANVVPLRQVAANG